MCKLELNKCLEYLSFSNGAKINHVFSKDYIFSQALAM